MKKKPTTDPCVDLLDALKYAVDQYGKPGGPWNVPSDPGGWIERAKAAIKKAGGRHETH